MKNIVAPNIPDYPAVVSDLAFEIGDGVRKGDRLCVLTLRSGRKIAIKAPVAGQITLLNMRNGAKCDAGQMLAAIDETVPVAAPEGETEPPDPAVQAQTPPAPGKPKRRHRPPKPAGAQINFLLWKGWGWLVPVVFCVGLFGAFWLMAEWTGGDAEVLINSRWLQGVTFLTPAVLVGLFGLWVNRRRAAVARNRVSTFLFLRAEYWAVPLAFVAIGSMVFLDMRLKEREETYAFLNKSMEDLAAAIQAERAEAEAAAEAAAAEAYRTAEYSFTLCNGSDEAAFAAVALKTRGNAEHMRMRSWFNVPRGGCLRPFTGRFDETTQATVYYHAVSPDWSTWGGQSGDAGTIDFCLPATDEDFLLSSRKRCRGRLERRTFAIRVMTREQPELKITLR